MIRRSSTEPEVDTLRIADTVVASRPPQVSIEGSLPPTPMASDDGRYQLRDVLGEGGMGEVRLCRDRRIGREVAIKVIRDESAARSDAVARFEREAKVQGQLEHPSVVPVYDLGVDSKGRSFFTMKRLRGRTLADVLEGLRKSDRVLEAEFSQRRLLVAFSQLCWAVAFAHSRGVLHRDVKPQNVMFGDFGEVHLLDWGIATVVEDLRETDQTGEGRSVVDAAIEPDHKTLMGEMVGTPGYMSPEQIEGDPSKIDERADVFGLGAVLFEILTLEPLVKGETLSAIMRSTVSGVDARAAARAPSRDVPPELERVCIRATAPLADRIASARELRDEVERFLDGDRDVALRKDLALGKLARAEERAAELDRLEDSAHERAEILRELAAAIALDPTNRRAQELLGQLLLGGQKELPPDAREVLETERRARRIVLRKMNVYMSFVFVSAPLFLLLLGVRSWEYFAVVVVANLLIPLAAIYSYVKKTDSHSPFILMGAAMTSVCLGFLVCGPLVTVPSNVFSIVIVATALTARQGRWLAIPLGVCAIVVPLGLQLAGVIAPSYVPRDGGILIVPLATELPMLPTLLFVTSLAVLSILLTGFMVLRQQQLLDRLEERLFLHAWTLKHLVPAGTDLPMPPESVNAKVKTR